MGEYNSDMNALSAAQPIASLTEMPQPIDRWLAGMAAEPVRALDELCAAYEENWPTQGELIFAGSCEFTCQHCIYAPAFAKHNRSLPVAEWGRVIEDIRSSLGIKTFVYGGRSVTDDGLDVLTQLRAKQPDAYIGLIDNGISMLPARERLLDVAADWLDISLDGQEAEHDIQRRRPGSYRAGLQGALWLARNRVAPKVNILSCLTRINQHSLIPMIRDLNAQGFKNFFITPVTVVDGVRPSVDLQLSAEEFAHFVKQIRVALNLLDDAWVEINLFPAVYAQNLAMLMPEIWRGLRADRDGLVWRDDVAEQSGTTFFIRYYPISLTGTRELIVNTNGDVIVPKAMASGRIADVHVVGSLTKCGAREVVKGLPGAKAFEFYKREFVLEQDLLKEFLNGSSK